LGCGVQSNDPGLDPLTRSQATQSAGSDDGV
jgi:hypothetical protein